MSMCPKGKLTFALSMSSPTAPRLLGPPAARLFSADEPSPPPHADAPLHADETSPVPDLAALQGAIDADWSTYANPCLNLFLAGDDTPPHRLRELLVAAWDCDDVTALKLICNLRGVRGTGKADREGFYTAALWMHQHHPRTLACNLSAFADFGYIKDFPELLYRLIKGPDVRKEAKTKAAAWAGQSQGRQKRARIDNRSIPSATAMPSSKRTTSIKPGAVEECSGPKEKEKETEAEAVAAPAASSKNKVARLAQMALRRYRDDPTYAFLFNSIADFFAERLRSDVDKLQSGKAHQIGLAAKWCPSLDSSFDQATLLCEAIARRLFPDDTAFHARNRLRREVLVPLRGALKLPEVFMCKNRWSDLPYDHVASVAMKRYEALFMKHDKVRFQAFKDSRDAKIAVAAGALPRASIAAPGAILPHKVVTASMAREDGPLHWRRATQWRAVVKHHDRGNKGLFCNCLAVCDVSSSMRGVRLDVCVALGLLISHLSGHPWNDHVYPFGEESHLHSIITGNDIKGGIRKILGLEVHCGDRIDLRSVFEFIHRTATRTSVTPKEMIRTIFVLTDKEFNEASASKWKADYRIMEDKFRSHGFRLVPQVVYWNLRGSHSPASTSHSDGVLRLNGFSDNFLALFLEKGGVVMPEDEMDAAIAGPEYKKPLVFD